MDTLKSTLLHTLELAVVLGIAFVAQKVFHVGNEAVMALVILVLGAAGKLIRTSPDIPVKDFVNEK